MKINILYGSNNVLSGFLNIDPVDTTPTFPAKIQRDIKNLDDICADGECDTIIMEDVIDYLSSNEVDEFITHILTKVSYGGKIIIGGLDIRSVAKGIYNGQIDLLNANIAIYGNQAKSWEFKKSALSLNDLKYLLINSGFHILSIRMNKYHYIIEAEKNG